MISSSIEKDIYMNERDLYIKYFTEFKIKFCDLYIKILLKKNLNHKKIRDNLINHNLFTIYITDIYPEFEWDYSLLSETKSRFKNKEIYNENIYKEIYDLELTKFILKHENLNWDYSKISSLQNLPYHFIQKNKDKNLDYDLLSENKNITNEFLRENIEKDLNFFSINDHPNITWDLIYNNLDKKWIPLLLSSNPIVTQDIILNYKNVSDFIEKTSGKTIPENTILYREKIKTNGWNSSISYNPNINMDFVKSNLHLNWNFTQLMHNKNIHFDDIMNNLDLPWDFQLFTIKYSDILKNTKITEKLLDLNNEYILSSMINEDNYDIILKNLDKNWDFGLLSSNSAVTLEFIVENIDKDWDFCILSSNNFVTLEFILENPDKDWDIESFLENNKNVKKIFEDISSLEPDKSKEWIQNICIKIFNIREEDIDLAIPKEEYDNIEKYNHDYIEEINRRINKFFYLISSNNHIELQIIEKYIHYNWNFNEIIKREEFNIEWIEKYSDKKWNINNLSYNNTNIYFDKYFTNDYQTMPKIELKKKYKNLFTIENYQKIIKKLGKIVFNDFKLLNYIKKENIDLDFIEDNIDYYVLFFDKVDFEKIRIKWILNQINKKKYRDQIFNELIEKAWHPNRLFDWCLSINE